MKYTSQNGCFFYYDRDTFSWELCEPTLMFLLGFEAITMYDKAKSDHLLISNRIYNTKTGIVDEMPDFPIYDEVLNYLSSLGPIEDNEYYAQYNCYGLKLLMNELTGIGTDRTVPVIFLNDVNRKLVDPNKYPYSDKAGKSYYDLQSTLILNVFKYAGYNLQDNEIIKVSEGIAGKDLYNITNSNVPPLLEEIRAYNESITTLHEEKQAAGGVYKLLDYKAMYLYSLGVLYGLRCMGYEGKMIWRFDPAYWYFDKYQNLVKTAWAVFRFHYSHPIYELDTPEELVNKYKDIQYNKLWNFMNDKNTSDVELYDNEVFAYAVHIEPRTEENENELNRISVKPIIYLYPTDQDVLDGSKGKYIEYLQDDQKWSDPVSVDGNDDESKNIVSSTEPYKGVIAADSDNYIRYIANDKVNIRKALRYSRNIASPDNPNDTLLPHYLSPNGDVLKTIPDGTVLSVLDVVGKFYKVTYTDSDNISTTGWINSIYTDTVGDGELETHDGEYLTGPFSSDWLDDNGLPSDASLGTVKVTSDTPIRTLVGSDWSYFISTGNFGWTDFDLTYWKNFKRYIRDDYEYSDAGKCLKDHDATYSSVLSMSPQEFKYLFPERIGTAFSSIDGSTISYYKCNVTEDTYLYGIFDGNISNFKKPDQGSDEPDYSDEPDFASAHTNVKDHFKYILSEIDFNSMYSDIAAPVGYEKSEYYNITTPVWIFVKKSSTPPPPEGSDTLWDGHNEVRIDKFGYTPTESIAVDAYYYKWPQDITEECPNPQPPPSPTHYDLRSYKFNNNLMYWSSEFNIEPVGDTDYYIKWKDSTESEFKIEKQTDLYVKPYPVHATTGETVTIYRNVRKLFDNTPYYYILKNGDSSTDYICNTNKSYEDEFSPYMSLGFIRYADIHTSVGVTPYVCPIVENDANGDSLIVNGVPQVWEDPYTDNENERYWNGFQNQWQSELPLLRNGQMFVVTYNPATGEVTGGTLVRINDNTADRTVTIDDGVTLTYEEFYSDPTRGILRPHTFKVFSEEFADEGIVDCYYDTKLLDNEHEDDHLVCIPGHTGWVKRSELKNDENHRYWIVDGTTSLYDGADAIKTVYDDEHKD